MPGGRELRNEHKSGARREQCYKRLNCAPSHPVADLTCSHKKLTLKRPND